MAGFSSNLLPVWLVPTALLLCLVVLALSIALIIFYRKRTKAWLVSSYLLIQNKMDFPLLLCIKFCAVSLTVFNI